MARSAKWEVRSVRKMIATVVLVCFFVIYAFWQVANSRSFQFFGEIIPRVKTTEKVVALTFDDGPTAKTPEILAILREIDVKATFFVTGKELEKNMQEGQLIAAAGHEIGNHTYSHSRMVLKFPSYVKEELEKTDELIRRTGYQREIFFRPPHAKKLFVLPYYLQQNNRKTITWDLEPDSISEIANDSQKMIDYVVSNATPGSIILLHPMYSSRQATMKALKGIVTGLRAQGYDFKTISELLEYSKQ